MPDPGLRADLDRALEAYDRPGAVAIALEAVAGGVVSISELYRVLSEIMVDIGATWQTGTTEVWQEHLVTGAVRNIVEACVRRVEETAPDPRTTVVLAAPEDEYHDLGLRMLADRFRLAGWRPHFLGANVPVSQLVSASDTLRADAVALSASTHFHRVSLKEYVAALSETRPALRVWVGGPAFALGGNGWPDEMVLDPLNLPPPEGR